MMRLRHFVVPGVEGVEEESLTLSRSEGRDESRRADIVGDVRGWADVG